MTHFPLLINKTILTDVLKLKEKKEAKEDEPYYYYVEHAKCFRVKFPPDDSIFFDPCHEWNQILWIFKYLEIPFSFSQVLIEIDDEVFEKDLTEINVLECLIEIYGKHVK